MLNCDYRYNNLGSSNGHAIFQLKSEVADNLEFGLPANLSIKLGNDSPSRP